VLRVFVLARPVAIALAWFGLARAAGGQVSSTGTIQGRVISPDSAGIGSVSVRVTRAGLGFGGEVLTDSTGTFRIAFLPPGEFRLSARRIGYRPSVFERVRVETGSITRLLVRLEPAARTLDSLVVSAPVLTIDPEGTEFGTALARRELALLPTPNEARDLVRFVTGARSDQVWGGATAQANNYQLDGVAVNHPGLGADLLQPAVSWIEEIQVRGLGAGAEHGNFQGGIVNVVTKSGTNQLEGGIRTAVESKRLNGSNLVLGEAGSEVSDRLELDGHLSGPLKRNRLFYALFGQIISRDLRVLNQVPENEADFVPLPPLERERRFLAKLTWLPSSRDAVSASVARFEAEVDRFGQTGFKTPEATLNQQAGSWLGSLAWQRTWSPKSFLEVKLSWYDGFDRREPYGGPDLPSVQLLNQVDPAEYQNAPYRERRAPSQWSIGALWDRYARTGRVQHRFKVGVEWSAGAWSFHRERNGGITWRPGFRVDPPFFDPGVPSTWVFNGVISNSWGGEIALDSRTQNGAWFVQDYVRVTDRLSINPGLRLGAWIGELAGSRGNWNTVVEDVALEPRIGIAYALTKNGSFALKAHWGRYHQNLFAAFFDRSNLAQVYSNEERWEYRGPQFSSPTATMTAAVRDQLERQGLIRRAETIRLNETGAVANYRQPYLDQAVLGLEKTLGERWKVDALYVRRRNQDMVALRDLNRDSNYTFFYNVVVLDRFNAPFFLNGKPLVIKRLAVSNEDIRFWADRSGDGLGTGGVGPPGMTAAQIAAARYLPWYQLENVPEAQRRFDQLQLRIQARYPTWWLDLGGTVTRLDGDLNTIVGSDDYSGSSAGPFVRLNEALNGFGRLTNQSRWEAKARFGGNLPFGIRGGAFASFASGDYYTPFLTLSNTLFNFDPVALNLPDRLRILQSHFFNFTSGHRVFLEPRGTYKYPARFTLDLHLERGFRIGRGTVGAYLDGFNILGAATVTETQNSYNGEVDPFAVSEFGAVRNRLPPRIIRIGSAIEF
jgi:hypothetical protein